MTRTTTSVCQPTGHGRLRPIRATRWQGDVVTRLVCEALANRDPDDPQSVTEATVALLDGVETLLDRPLGGYETQRLGRLAATAKPSTIIRLLHRLNGGVRDRQARRLATRDIIDLAWG